MTSTISEAEKTPLVQR